MHLCPEMVELHFTLLWIDTHCNISINLGACSVRCHVLYPLNSLQFRDDIISYSIGCGIIYVLYRLSKHSVTLPHPQQTPGNTVCISGDNVHGIFSHDDCCGSSITKDHSSSTSNQILFIVYTLPQTDYIQPKQTQTYKAFQHQWAAFLTHGIPKESVPIVSLGWHFSCHTSAN